MMLPRPSAVVRHMQTTQSGLAAVARHFPDVSFPSLFLAPQKNEHENRLTVKCAFLLFVLFFGGVLVPPLFPATAWEEGEVDVSCFFLWQSPLREHTQMATPPTGGAPYNGPAPTPGAPVGHATGVGQRRQRFAGGWLRAPFVSRILGVRPAVAWV